MKNRHKGNSDFFNKEYYGKFINGNKKNGNRNYNKNMPKVVVLIGKTFVCLVLLFIIALSIVVLALTVYVMKVTDQGLNISLEKDSIVGREHTVLYAKDENGKLTKISRVGSGVKRLWVDITEVPKCVIDAFIALEDRKFYEHDGVDFWRTFGAFLNMFLHFWKTNQGGSTITQQLLKNLTGEKDVVGFKGLSRKFHEIHKAMSLEKKYSKDQILQAYLNVVYVGGNNGNYLGIKTAARLYFNKNLEDLTIAEAACLAALIRNPRKYDMLKNPNKITDRRNYTLRNMYELGFITKQQLEEAKSSPVVPKRGEFKDVGLDSNRQSYFVDAALNQLVAEYMNVKDIRDWNIANDNIKNSGLHVYTTLDPKMQEKLENIYENDLKFEKNIESAFVVFDLHGNMKACVGGLGKKPLGDRSCLNYATNAKALILPGSTMKPFVYTYMLEKNYLTYSSLFQDSPFKIVQGKPWPENYDNKHSDNMVTVKYAIERSLNTIPTKILNDIGINGIVDFCNFLKNTLKISTIVSPKNPLKGGVFETSAMAMGSLTKGVILSEFANAFQIFANGGNFTKATTIEKVIDSSGQDILNFDMTSKKVISSDTSAVMNRLLRNVVLPSGTGALANLKTTEVCGKTGTSNDGRNLVFIGITPRLVSALWIGSLNEKPISRHNNIKCPKIWADIMRRIVNVKEYETFSSAAAKEQIYCCESGLLANQNCPKKEKGYYRRNNFLTMHCPVHR